MPDLSAHPVRIRALVEQRLSWVESELVRGRRPTVVAREFSERFGVGRRMGRKYVQRVHQRWLEEARPEDRELARGRLLAQARALHETALARTRAITVGVGEGAQRVEHVPDPDVRGATDALKLCALLEGVAATAGNLQLVQNNLVVGAGDPDAAIRALQTFFVGPQQLPPPNPSAVLDVPAEAEQEAQR